MVSNFKKGDIVKCVSDFSYAGERCFTQYKTYKVLGVEERMHHTNNYTLLKLINDVGVSHDIYYVFFIIHNNFKPTKQLNKHKI